MRAILGLVLLALACAFVCIVALTLPQCGPTSVQIKQEVWQCEASTEGENGTTNFTGCKRDGASQDSQGSGQEGGPSVDVKRPEPVGLAPSAWQARLN